NCIMTPEESSKQVKIIDKKIEQFAQYLQRKNNCKNIPLIISYQAVSLSQAHGFNYAIYKDVVLDF
ncbi:MAG: hypothetical protein E6993_11390, partial [Staphylococcus epidermidis]|nr:hypothetical protein [Staphylococcus epidermidis]